MATDNSQESKNLLDIENKEWRESLDYVLKEQGPERVRQILRQLQIRAQEHPTNTPAKLPWKQRAGASH